MKTQSDKSTLPQPQLFLSDARGIYIPRDFARDIKRELVSGVTGEQLDELANDDNASGEWYWDAWDDILSNCIVTDEKGQQWRLNQDGDLWLIPVGMEWDDATEWYVWPKEEAIVLYPENPVHTDNLSSIELLEMQGFEGSDASLDISLFEYGFAWRKLEAPMKDGEDVVFIYGIKVNECGEFISFDRVTYRSKEVDVIAEWDWAFKERHSFLSSYGMTEDEFQDQPFEMKVYQLFSNFGAEEIFGSSYWEGFTISDE
jgi:hypothetical protein